MPAIYKNLANIPFCWTQLPKTVMCEIVLWFFVIGVNIVIDQMTVGEKQFLLSPMVIHHPIQTVDTHIVCFEIVILVIILINVTIVHTF